MSDFNNIVLCIPRVLNNITNKQIIHIFNKLKLGKINKIDCVSKKEDKFKKVFIHFSEWFTNENANLSKNILQSGKEIKIIYDTPWFWKVSLYKKYI
jgi:hypothetical protein